MKITFWKTSTWVLMLGVSIFAGAISDWHWHVLNLMVSAKVMLIVAFVLLIVEIPVFLDSLIQKWSKANGDNSKD